MKNNFFILMLLSAIMLGTMTSCEDDKEKEDENIPKYTVSFDSKGGTPTPQQQTVNEGGKVTRPADPTREGYGLAGWSKADNETSALWNFETETVAGNMKLYARWSINGYLVTFDSDGGTAVENKTIAHGGTVAKPADPTRDGYELDGWFNGDTEWNFTTAITAAITIKAKWTAAFTVTIDSDGDDDATGQTIRYGETITKPEDPTRNGYAFDGWFVGDTEWDFDVPVTAPVIIKAKWTAVHTVTFDTGSGGSVVTAQPIRDGEKATQPSAEPTREFRLTSGLYLGTIDLDAFPSHHTFVEWRKEGEDTAYDFATPITDRKSVV